MKIEKTQYLLACLAEECAEVTQRCTKMLRFGVGETQSGQELNNTERLAYELNDLMAVLELLKENGLQLENLGDRTKIDLKKEKVKKYMVYSEKVGIL